MHIEKQYKLLYTKGNQIFDNGLMFDTLENLKANFHKPNWVIVPIDDLPENWHEMTIVNKELVAATPEVLAERKALKLAHDTEAVRTARELRYKSDADPLMIHVVEAFAEANPDNEACKAWLLAKATVKAKLPKPQEGVVL